MTQDVYIVAAVRSPVGKARGVLHQTRPDDLLAQVLKAALAQCPSLDPALIGDVIVGCAMPEAEQGLNMARIALLLAGLPSRVPGMTVNRFCASGLQAIALAADRIRLGEAEAMIAAGSESMSLIPMMGNKIAFNPAIIGSEQHTIAYGMGLTAEKVAQRWKISREAQDQFALASHEKALAAQASGAFTQEILPLSVAVRSAAANGSIAQQLISVTQDEGPRAGTLDSLAKLKPVFAARGTVTAGNSSQMSDGAAALVLVNERLVHELKLQPLGRFLGYSVVGVPPEIMGIGPTLAIPQVLKRVGLTQQQLDWIELNEAFAAQALAVMQELELDPTRVNPLGGAIALGHPLGATGAIRATTLLHGLRRQRQRYGMVSMCIGTGMGAAGVFEAL